MKYLLVTNYYPQSSYDIGNQCIFRIVKNPYSFEALCRRELRTLNGQVWSYSLVIPDTFKLWNELVIYHSFITNNPQTYNYAENAQKLFFEDRELEYIDSIDLVRKDSNSGIVITDFNEYPLLMSCNQKPESEYVYKYINYKSGLEKFIELKDRKPKSMSGHYNLYDLICLYEFAKSFDITHRIYRNSNISLSFYVTILESLIGKPENCGVKLHCRECGSKIQHSKVSLEGHFRKYFGRYRSIRSIRHKTFHEGSSFDFGKYFYNAMINNQNRQNDKCIELYRNDKEEIECMIRILLTGEFYKYYINSNGIMLQN
jgi:hypothetical protein